MGDGIAGLGDELGRENSFARVLAQVAPELLPWNTKADGPVAPLHLAHGTTILAVVHADGVVMAGDRRATMGNVIAQRDLEKVALADEFSAVAFAGTVGLATEMVRLFQRELEHYEKVEGQPLSLDGKARRLATLVQGNLAQAVQGLAVIPVFAGYDQSSGRGRIFSFDVTGGPYETADHYADGSGSPYARGALKKLWRPGLSLRDAVFVCVQALYDAADDDSATGGPDLTRRIFPTVSAVTAEGYRALPESEIREIAEAVVAARMQAPNGPVASLTG
ncbi:proteasome subunit beta [Actinocorallia herbida]|uniref:proteasome subunit beta n=1 Tax=Actinocorallia herbida TaxID=58109 RepID=UPI001FEBD8E6|nr:proteasome subunit beta [Actinocorallia herbida]